MTVVRTITTLAHREAQHRFPPLAISALRVRGETRGTQTHTSRATLVQFALCGVPIEHTRQLTQQINDMNQKHIFINSGTRRSPGLTAI
jgi:hypothetical protein